jgi:histidinol-phosphate/aromatic aminotransferase/cobyric acid decarboxylase-like protein
MRGLRQRGILVRHFTRLAGIGDALRITIASAAVMERVLVALREAAVEPANAQLHAGGA